MGLVTSFQAFTRIASVIVLTGLVFSAFSILLKERLSSTKLQSSYMLIMLSGDASFTQARIQTPQKRMQSMTQQSWFQQTRANKKTLQMMMNQKMPTLMGRQQTRIGQLNRKQKDKRNKNSTVLLLQRSVQVRLASFERYVHKFPDFPKCLSSSGNKRKRRKLFQRDSLSNTK